MKRRKLVRHLQKNGCYLDREGGNHSIFRNPVNGSCTAVARHREIHEIVARVICDQLDIPRP